MKNKLSISVFFSLAAIALYAAPIPENGHNDKSWGADSALQYLLDEVALDPTLSKEKQLEKLQEFQKFSAQLSPEVSSRLVNLILEKTHARVLHILQNAGLDEWEVNARAADYEKAILRTQNMNVEIARQMLFFVAELEIHRQHVYEFGTALGCPARQLLRHDLCKLSADQCEGYARYFRGGKQEGDKQAFLTAWEFHQCEEHHHECYRKEGFSFVGFSEERLRNNMLEVVADVLAATKQRGGNTMLNWFIKVFPESNPHPCLIPFLKEALIKAHTLYLEAEKNPHSDSIFKGFPCWNSELEEVFRKLAM